MTVRGSRSPYVSVCSCFALFLAYADRAASRLTAEKRRLESEEEQAEEELIELQQQMNERLSRLMRLRRQRKQLQERGVEMVRRGLRSLDELDEAERQEADAVIEVQAHGGVDAIDWSTMFDFGAASSSSGVARGTSSVDAARG